MLRLISAARSDRDGKHMADQGAPMDMPAHERTYGSFINLFKYGAVACFLIAMLIILIISR